ncbi:PAS domain-containing sensor histidine kinase [Phenylobacterium sp.]|uniref:PAS domain-containing sensor histidine kinase n=1 Tax=Phenylobacterium sp. TaxID=1871053 RepID=UPI0011FC8515|nr:PAS domain-containing sensor histidine kinase [Phenylobacterium sp.]THD56544.1 MAG: PAS domain-containing sensor histidine kinase [Phenylobacterium sp.]
MDLGVAQRLRQPERFAVFIAVVVVAIAISALLGWRVGSVPLTSVIVGAVALQPTTAIALIVGAFGLAAGAMRQRWTSRAAGAVLVGACLYWLFAYVSPHAVPVDLLLFRDRVLAQQPLPLWPGRPSIITCVVIALFGASLTGVGVRQPRLKLLAIGAASLGALIASLSILPYLLQDPTQLTILHQSLRIALNTSVGVGALCAGVLILKRDSGWVRLVAGGGEQGRIARVLVPVALVPVAFGMLANVGVRTGLYGPDVRMLLIIVLSAVALLFLAFWAARTMGRERNRREILVSALERSTVMIVDGSGRLQHWPPACEALYGWTAAEVLGRRPGEFLNVEGASVREATRAAIREHGEWRGEIQHWTKAGGIRWVALQWVLQHAGDGDDRVVGTISDITDLKLAEASLRESQERLTLAVGAYDLGIYDIDVPADVLFADEGMERLFGVEPGGMNGSLAVLRGRIVDGDVLTARRLAEEAVARRLPAMIDDMCILRPDGEIRYLYGSRRFFYSEAGVHVRTIGVYRDVTELKLAEAVAKENQERLKLAVDAYHLGIADADIVNRTIVADTGFERLLALPEGGLEGSLAKLDAMVVWKDPDRDLDIAAHKPQQFDDVRMRRADGEIRDFHGVRRFFYSPEGAHVRTIGIYRDVTDERRAQAELAVRGDHLSQLRAELAHVSRLSAMGEMAAALAHELNQPLTAIGNSVGALKIMLSDGGRTLDDAARARIVRAANQAEGQAVRAGEIVRRLRDFIARGEADARIEQLDHLIEDAVALGAPNAKADGTDIHFEFSPKAGRVLADRIQIQQILVNLVRNATEAMRGRPAPHVLTISTMAKEGMVEVSVRDNGPGVALDFATQLFSPFRSTKNDGMGVGLSICRRIVEAHGGRMWLEDSEGPGADFRFTIPLVTKELQHA